MYINHIIGYYAAVLAAIIVTALIILHWRHGGFVWLPVYASLLFLHPAWTMGVVSGDCGQGKRNLSILISAVFVSLLLRQIYRPRLTMRWFLFLLGLSALGMYLSDIVYGLIVRYFGGPPEFLLPLVPFGFQHLLPFGLAAVAVSLLIYAYNRHRSPSHAV